MTVSLRFAFRGEEKTSRGSISVLDDETMVGTDGVDEVLETIVFFSNRISEEHFLLDSSDEERMRCTKEEE